MQEIKARQWVVDSRPFNNPALPRILEPVQTEAVILVFADVSTIAPQEGIILYLFTCSAATGTIRRSRFGQVN